MANKFPSGYLRIYLYTRFDLRGSILKSSKVNLRSYSFTPGLKLALDFIHFPIVPLIIDPAPNSSRTEVDGNFTLTTTNNQNLPKVETEEVDTCFDDPRNTSHTPNR